MCQFRQIKSCLRINGRQGCRWGQKDYGIYTGGTTLGGRTNIILTSDQNYSYGNAKIVHDMDEAMEELKNYADEDIFVVGGEKVYKEFFPYCERAYITKVDYEYQADAYLENFEESDEWIMTHDSDEWTYYDLEYYFYQYKRR